MDRQSSITPRDLECMLCDEMADPKALPLSLLEEITCGFSDEQEIGRGGFAVVYKGKLENRTVAVKRMSNTFMYEKEFHREVECLMMVKHKNVVRFLGYCADTQGSMEKYDGKFIMADVQQRLLCFEYLPKGTLHEYITDTSNGLQWRDRYNIIKGICQGLHYLHQKNIVHLDLKPANILLDENLVAKITDFGISRCFDKMQSQIVTKIGGTYGYLAPESFNHTEVTYRHSYRLDIYSLGVLIIEILTGKKGYHDVDDVVESWSNMLEKSKNGVQLEQVRVCAEIGIECIESNPAKRPDTQHIINRLDETESMDLHIKTRVSTSHQAKHPPNELHQATPNNPGEASSEENATAVTVAETNPYISLWKNTAKFDMSNETANILLWSYQQLNPNIRRCLEYCSIFPRRSKLYRNKLVALWIAQGFVKTSYATEDIEDVAEGYIQELVSYSLLQPEETSDQELLSYSLLQTEDSSDGEGCFTIHDVLHDLLDKVARNCFRIENARSQGEKGWEGDVPQDVQHLFVEKYDIELFTKTILGLENLCTLIIYIVEEGTPIHESVIASICNRLPKLRVLAVAFSQEHGPIKEPINLWVPESISQLKHLRYFSFRTCKYCKVILPITINKLQHIQLLDFGYGGIVEFDFGYHVNLRYIICKFGGEHPNIGRLISLQTLGHFKVRNEQGYDLKQLRDLNKLRGCLNIKNLENVRSKEEALEANLAAKERLKKLILKWDGACTAERCTREVEAEVLEGLCPPVGLDALHIYNYYGLRYPDWMVGKQNGGLQKLALWRWSQLGPAPQLVEAFPHLRVLGLYFCSWDALPGNMEHLALLKELVIFGCVNIRSLPTLPQSLEAFRLVFCNVELMDSCQRVGDPNLQKIKHIREKRFR